MPEPSPEIKLQPDATTETVNNFVNRPGPEHHLASFIHSIAPVALIGLAVISAYNLIRNSSLRLSMNSA